MTCLQCRSTRIIADVRVIDHAHGNSKKDLQVEVYENPGALIFKGMHAAKLTAHICEDCGLVMFTIPPETARELRLAQSNQS
ncbi:MAG: hypothetical protein HJJLKODD_01268 [Phycisphaerae bacterium]|nr:hypothetical protein [Phycisphaerae bacterium]